MPGIFANASQYRGAAQAVNGSPGTAGSPATPTGAYNAGVQGYQNPAAVIQAAGQTGSGQIITYPPNELGVYYMLFPFASYDKNFYGSAASGSAGTINVNVLETVGLPMPKDIKFTHDQQYNEMTRPPLVGSFLSGGGGNALGEVAAAVALVGAEAANDKVNGLGTAILNQKGLAPNPFLAVQYQSPEFRTHNFTWTFSPQGPTESSVLQNIIRIFQYHEASDYALGSNLLYGYPDIVKPIYSNEGQLYPFKWCVIKSFGVDYSGGGAPAFFSGTKAPAIVQIAISLQEIELFMKSDFNPV